MRFAGLLALALAAALTAPSPAAAASLRTVRDCYQERGDVVAAGSGFAPNSVVTVSRDGKSLGTAFSDEDGRFTARFATPRLPADRTQRAYRLVATDGANSAIVRYHATKVLADFTPRSGNLGALRVRFRVRGFNLVEPRSRVYLHYVRPNGTLRRTIRLGTARGPCGHIRRTRRRQLFPFDAQRGRWTLQFDTRRTYRRATASSTFVWVRRPVQVFAAGG